ncbi:MAG: class I SAM-dependent methyltransferase [Ktedonobacterales bacterium]|nr:class I SAM-dependent methyltransferase [Ktedonobacterales bacterium]
MERYLTDLFIASAEDQHLRAPRWMIRTYLSLFGPPLAKSLRIDMVKGFLRGQDLRGKRILDVGCGIGDLAFMLSRRGAEVIGVELDPAKVASANQIAEKWHFDHVRFIAADVAHLEAMGLGQFDAVFCLALLEHVPDDIGLLRQIQALLRPGGLFVMDVPNAKRKTIAEVEEADGHQRPGYIFEEVPDLLANAGLHVTKQRTMDPWGLIYYWWAASRPGSKRERWLYTALAPVFLPLIRVTSVISKRPGTELCFMAVKD